MTDILVPKSSEKFRCQTCDYSTSRRSQYERHILSRKHHDTDKILTNTDAKCSESSGALTVSFLCDCGKEYKHRQSLFNHKKYCKSNENNENNETNKTSTTELTNLVLQVVKQNKELASQNQELTNKLFEVCKNSITNNITNTNSHNKTFNLNLFLNETCKDAMNIMDFVDSLKLQLSDLENVGKIGFIEGISNIIVKNLNSLDETKRPVHCTDAKREIMYIKDEDKWEKENDNKQKMRKVIKKIAHKNSMMLNEFKSKHPDCLKSESKYSDKYNTLTFEAMGGKGDDDLEKEDKIIKNIAKEVVIEKS